MCIRKKVLLILTIVMTLFIWGQSFIPYEVSSSESTAISNVISNTSKALKERQSTGKMQQETTKHILKVLWYMRNHIRKIAHVLEYCILGVLVLLLTNMYSLPFSKQIYFFCSMVFLVGFLDESIQLLPILNRTAEINDVWLDFLGSLLGGTIALLFIHIKKRRMV